MPHRRHHHYDPGALCGGGVLLGLFGAMIPEGECIFVPEGGALYQ